MKKENNAITLVNDDNPVLSTMLAETKKEKITFYNAVENPVAKVSDFINQELTISNVYMETATYNTDEGTTNNGIKTVIINAEGEGILANSVGIAKSLISIFNVFGMPSEWDEPLTVKVKQVETRNGRYFKLEVVG